MATRPVHRRIALPGWAVGVAVAVPMVVAAQAGDPLAPRLSGRIEERQQDLRRDSGGRLIGLTQGDAPQDITALGAHLPTRRGPSAWCFKARNRDGTYAADGELAAPPGAAQALGVEAPGFPRIARTKGLVQTQPQDLALVFYPAPCAGERPVNYPAAFGARPSRLAATLNLGPLNGAPAARLEPRDGGPGLTGACSQLAGRSVTFNVVCQFALPPGFAGGMHLLSVDYKPSRGPSSTVDFQVWTAPHRP